MRSRPPKPLQTKYTDVKNSCPSRLPRQPSGPVRLAAAQREEIKAKDVGPEHTLPQAGLAGPHKCTVVQASLACWARHVAHLSTRLYVTIIDSPCASANSSTAPLTAPSCLLPSMHTAARVQVAGCRSGAAAQWQVRLATTTVQDLTAHKPALGLWSNTAGEKRCSAGIVFSCSARRRRRTRLLRSTARRCRAPPLPRPCQQRQLPSLVEKAHAPDQSCVLPGLAATSPAVR